MDVVLHPAGEQELDDVLDYFPATDPALAGSFLDFYIKYRIKLATNPEHFRIRRGIVRRANLFPRFREYYLPFMI